MKTRQILGIEHVGSTSVKGLVAKLYPEDIEHYILHKGQVIEEIYRKCGLIE